MDSAKQRLELALETHYCDLKETSEYESRLKNASDAYFQDKNLNNYVKIFEGLSDEKRLKILHLLTIREMCNCELTAAINSTQPNLTYHIKKLENARLVKKRRAGKFIYYSLEKNKDVNNLLKIISKEQ